MITISRFAALILFAAITIATLSPIDLRPHFADPNVERALAYVVFGVALALGFPDRLMQTLVAAALVAGVLELLQIVDPGRHARFSDAVLKALAGFIGIAIGHAIIAASRKRIGG
ncbi:VanZ family protein [Mesorhizobium sp. ORM8.1]